MKLSKQKFEVLVIPYKTLDRYTKNHAWLVAASYLQQ